jgi:integral membrane protein (TIGR01906 family)
VTATLGNVDGLSVVPSALRWLGAILFVVAVPTFLIIGSVLEVASDRDWMEQEFASYDIGRVTGLDQTQLRTVADTFIEYLRNPAASLDLTVTLGGTQRPLFNQREIDHMKDVQQIFTLIRRLRMAAGSVLLILPLIGIYLAGGAFLPRLGLLLAAGGILTVVLLGLAGLLSLVDFTQAFITFHELAFSNDLWMLDPRTDYLVMLFPEGFWFDATIRIAITSAIEGVIATGLGIALMVLERRSSN